MRDVRRTYAVLSSAGGGALLVRCPFCDAEVTVRAQSLRGRGKLCACGAKFLHDQASRMTELSPAEAARVDAAARIAETAQVTVPALPTPAPPARRVNETRYRSLGPMARDPRIVRIWDEDQDGLWAQLAPGYNFDGASCLHEATCRDLLRAWRTRISVGDPW